jgi:hypothetical protein
MDRLKPILLFLLTLRFNQVSALTLVVSPSVNPVTSAAGSAPATVPTTISPAVSGRVPLL